MKIGFLITARMKSTRLPNKLTLEVFNREMIALMIDRLKLASEVSEIIITTSTNPQDDILEVIAKREGVKCFRGSEEDVLERIYQTGKHFYLDYIINITGDCPLVGYDFIPMLINEYERTQSDLITSMKLPHGFFFYGIKPAALKKVLEIKNSQETEVWGSYFTETGLFKCLDLNTPDELIRKNFRLTLDYDVDFLFFKKLYENFGPKIISATTIEIIEYLDKHPEIVTINADAANEYKIRWDKQNKINLK